MCLMSVMVVIKVAIVLVLTGTVEEAICVDKVDTELVVLNVVVSRVLIVVNVVDFEVVV